ncbi:hypothetical protein IPF37_05570 [bacterium]|nr:MAG: hypothetical protein IPF37_05570 [bacterium]
MFITTATTPYNRMISMSYRNTLKLFVQGCQTFRQEQVPTVQPTNATIQT